MSIVIYFSTFGLSLILYYFYLKKYKSNKDNISLLGLLVILFPIILSGFRYNTGTDYFSYNNIYHKINQKNILDSIINFNSNIEIGYICLNKIIGIIFGNNEVFLHLIVSFIITYLFFYGINNYNKNNKIISLFIYYMVFYSITYNAMRQMIAVSIVFVSLKYIINKNFKKYILMVLIASLFHKTALFCIIFYFINFKSQNKIKNLIFYLIIIISSPIYIKYFINVLKYLSSKFNLYVNYFNIQEINGIYFLLYILPIFFIILLYRKNLLKNDYTNEFFIKLYCFQIPLQYLGVYFQYLDRLSLYSSISQLILIPRLMNSLQYKNKQLIQILIILWYLLYYFVMFYYFNANEVYPYKNIFNK